jgi:hypothetical protein
MKKIPCTLMLVNSGYPKDEKLSLYLPEELAIVGQYVILTVEADTGRHQELWSVDRVFTEIHIANRPVSLENEFEVNVPNLVQG